VATQQRGGAPNKAPRASGQVKSVQRAMLVIELLTEEPKGLTFAQIVQRLSLPKSSAYELLRTMKDGGHLALDEEGRYRIGLRIWQAGQTHEQAFDLATAARPNLQAARDELSETIQLAVLDGTENVYLAKEEAEQRLVLQSRVGARLPAYATGLGKVLLAGLSNDEVLDRFAAAELYSFTPNTVTQLPDLITQLEEVRRRGYSMDHGEYTEGVVCVAVPVRDHRGAVVAAMSVSVPAIRADDRFEARAATVLSRQAASLSADLGYKKVGP
jgi:IclR family KDG regulon transcriptional repressor